MVVTAETKKELEMKFDAKRVYSAVNADNVKIGSKGYFANTLKKLKEVVNQECEYNYGEVSEIESETYESRFYIKNDYEYTLFYLVEEPKVEVKSLSLNEIAKISYVNAKKREANGGHVSIETSSMLKHCATEVIEATGAYIRWSCAEEHLQECRDSFISELADIICCCTIIAGRETIDLDKAVADCLEKNRKRAEGTGDKK